MKGQSIQPPSPLPPTYPTKRFTGRGGDISNGADGNQSVMKRPGANPMRKGKRKKF